MVKKYYVITGIVAVICVAVGYAVGNYVATVSFKDYEEELLARIRRLQAELGMPPCEEELRVYTWSWYINPYMIELFKKAYGVRRVVYKTFESTEEVWAKLLTNQTGYDVVCISDVEVANAIQFNLIQRLNKTLIPNLEYVDEKFRYGKYYFFDPGNNYSVPYSWGTTGIGYDASLVTDPVTGWEQLFDFSPGGFLEKYRGKITMLDDMTETFGAALKYLGYSLADTDPEHLEQAKNLLIQQKRYLKMYAGADLYIPYMANPEATGFWICHVWDGDLYIAKEANPNLVYVLPKEGGMLWVDCMVIPNGAPHPVAAHAWINFFCDPYVSALNTMYIHYASPIKISVEKLVPPWIIQTGMYPLYTEETLEKFEFRKIYTEEERALLLELWTELKMA